MNRTPPGKPKQNSMNSTATSNGTTARNTPVPSSTPSPATSPTPTSPIQQATSRKSISLAHVMTGSKRADTSEKHEKQPNRAWLAISKQFKFLERFAGRSKAKQRTESGALKPAKKSSLSNLVSLNTAAPTLKNKESLEPIKVRTEPELRGRSSTQTKLKPAPVISNEPAKDKSVVLHTSERDTAKTGPKLSESGYTLNPEFAKKYRLSNQLGFGGHGHVYSAERISDKKEFAVKFIKKDKIPFSRWVVDKDLGRIPIEVYVLKNVNHKNIIKFIEYFTDAVYIIVVQEVFGTEWSVIELDQSPNAQQQSKGDSHAPPAPPPEIGFRPTLHRSTDLFDLLETRLLAEDECRLIFRQTARVMDFMLSEHDIIHGDIKDENILVNEQLDIKLIDFGGAIRITDSAIPVSPVSSPRNSDAFSIPAPPTDEATPSYRARSGSRSRDSISKPHTLVPRNLFNGTTMFAPPEISMSRHSTYDAEKAEVWTLGVLLHTMLFRTLPFPADAKRKRFRLNIVVCRKSEMADHDGQRKPFSGPDDIVGQWAPGVWLEPIDSLFTIPAKRKLLPGARSKSTDSKEREARLHRTSISSEVPFTENRSTSGSLMRPGRRPVVAEDYESAAKLVVVSTPCSTPGFEGLAVVRELSAAAVKLLHSILEVEPRKRPSLRDVVDDPWVRDVSRQSSRR